MSCERRHKVISLEHRQKIIEVLKSYEEKGSKPNYSAVARQFNVSTKTITRIRERNERNENSLLKFKDAGTIPSLAKQKELAILNSLDERLYQWYRQKKDAGEYLFGVDLREKALLLNDELQGSPNFKASEAWLSRFKIRYQIGPILRSSQKIPPDAEICGKFLKTFSTLIQKKCFKLYQIYNVNESHLIWRSMPGDILESHIRNKEDFYHLKERVTIVTCCNANGSHKIPLFVIGDSRNSHHFENFHLNQLPVTYVQSKNCEMTNEVFRLWYTQLFLPSVRRYQIERNQFNKVLLVMNSATCGMLKDEVNAIDKTSIVEFIPSKVISKLQPMKQGVVTKLKRLYRRSFLKELLLEENVEGILEFIRQRNIKTFSVQIASAWKDVTATDIRRSWRKIIPNIEFGNSAKDDISVEKVLLILNQIPGFYSCTRDDVNEWFRNDNIILEIDEDPVMIVNQQNDCFQDNEDDAEEKTNTFQAAQEAVEAFTKYRTWLESQCECGPDHLIALQKLSELTKEIIAQINSNEKLSSFIQIEEISL